MITNWPNAIAHIDADYFFANCELARNPDLRGKPVMVLGKLDSCILAKTPEAKRLGIKTALPVWEAKKLCPNGIFIHGDFRYYTLLSRQMMSIFRDWSPVVEVYSVDEAFMDMGGLRGMYRKSYSQIGDAMREQIRNQLGITVSVGVSVNKTLAKMACEVNKPDGTTVIRGKDIEIFLSQIPVTDIPGIGFSRGDLLRKYKINNCLQFAQMPEDRIQKMFGKMGIFLHRELRGETSFPILSDPPPPKTIGRTSSFDKPVTDIRLVEGLAFFHLERALEALHRHKLLTGEMTLYLREKDFHMYGISQKLDNPTNDFFKLATELGKLIKQIPSGKVWRSVGAILTKLSPAKNLQYDLFEGAERSVKAEKLNDAKEELKEMYGRHAVRSGSTLFMNRKCNSGQDRMNIPFLI
jgi:DNA polymerase-4/DNA polymerase V